MVQNMAPGRAWLKMIGKRSRLQKMQEDITAVMECENRSEWNMFCAAGFPHEKVIPTRATHAMAQRCTS